MTAARSDLRLCFVGDSFVAGVGDPLHLGWVGRVCARGEREGIHCTAYNLGVRRDTSRLVRDRWERECAPRLVTGCDNRVVLSFGVNDTTVENGELRVTPRDSAEHLDHILRCANAKRWRTLVVGPPPVTDDEKNARTAHLAERLRAVCQAHATPYVDVFDALLASGVWVQEAVAGDGAHPAARGYDELAALVYPAWAAWMGARR